MKTQTSQRLLRNTVTSAIAFVGALGAIAAVTFVVTLPVRAESCRSLSQSASAREASVATQPSNAGTIVEIAASNSSFSTLVKAVQAAGLADVLSGEGPYTVFAPTDAAFAALPKGTLETLLRPENREKLQKILTYHVIPGAVESTTLRSGRVKTVEGNPVNLRVTSGRVLVNNARVTTADIKASNGVIHVIDKVILPPGL